MNQLSEKELSMLNDALAEEDRLVKKFHKLADEAEDTQVQSFFKEIANKHQGHFNALYEQLK